MDPEKGLRSGFRAVLSAVMGVLMKSLKQEPEVKNIGLMKFLIL